MQWAIIKKDLQSITTNKQVFVTILVVPFCPIRFSQFTSTIRDDPTDRCRSGCQTEFDQAIDE